jgi:signal peptidase I
MKPGDRYSVTTLRVEVMPKVKQTLERWWTEWLRSVLLIVLIITSFRSAVADWNDVPTGSMKPTIFEGDRIVVNKMAYDLKIPFTTWRLVSWANPSRGDIVVLYSPVDGKRLVKRVVGIPGDIVSMVNDRLIVNGETVSYAAPNSDLVAGPTPGCSGKLIAAENLDGRPHAVVISRGAHCRPNFSPVTVPSNAYFLMGDNRDESFDSRYFGPVPRDRIVGRATVVAASVDPERSFRPRWERFFRELR